MRSQVSNILSIRFPCEGGSGHYGNFVASCQRSRATVACVYLTTDLTNPNTSIEAIVAQDKVPGGGTVSSMAKSHTVEGKNYFCGVNTDFFHTSGSASNGKSIVGAPVRASVAGGEIYRSGSASTSWPNIFVDRDGKMNIGAVSFEMERLQRAERLPLSRQSTTTLLTMVFQSIHRSITALLTSRGLTVSV